jgi:hypothetical protein
MRIKRQAAMMATALLLGVAGGATFGMVQADAKARIAPPARVEARQPYEAPSPTVEMAGQDRGEDAVYQLPRSQPDRIHGSFFGRPRAAGSTAWHIQEG